MTTESIFKCLVRECKKIKKTRGLCYCCYNRLMKRIHAGELTWNQAEIQGLCLPAQPKKIYMVGFRP